MSSLSIAKINSPLSLTSSRSLQRFHRPCMPRSVRHGHMIARAQVEKQKETPPSPTSSPPPTDDTTQEEPRDFWEGERWEFLGNIANYILPVIVAGGVAVGFFASQTYNNDASVFLESPRGPEDTATLVKFE